MDAYVRLAMTCDTKTCDTKAGDENHSSKMYGIAHVAVDCAPHRMSAAERMVAGTLSHRRRNAAVGPSDAASAHPENFPRELEQLAGFGINQFRPNFLASQSLDFHYVIA
jgi:hypothetical protein